MGMRVRCGADHLDAVSADLIDRSATNISCETETAGCLIQACAPLANLVGYRASLGKLTAGTGEHVMWLSHYAPADGTPPDGQAA